jgi:hypothetical protein
MSHIPSCRAHLNGFSMLAFLVSTNGCTNLELLAENECGNLVVETAIGEDCDGGEGCGAPGSIHECRFTCETADQICPKSLGYHCGADAVCRQSKRIYAPLSTNTTVNAQDMLVGDVNADGCADIIVGAKRSTTLYAFASPFSTECSESRQTLNTSRPDPEQNALPLASLADMDTTDNTDRLSLLSPSRSLFGDGLSMHFTSGSPRLSPVLFPRFQRGGASVRTVAASMRGTGAIVLFESSADGTTSDVTLIFDPQQAPVTIPKAYAHKVTDIAAVIAADVDPNVNSMPNILCDEIIIAAHGETKLELYKICTSDTTNGFTKLQNPQITLTNTSVRTTGASIFAADANGDQITDIITNTQDKKVHVAFGFGDGRFHSLPPGPMPPPMLDQKANAINDAMADNAAMDSKIFVALEFDPMHPGVDYYGPPCPPLDTFSSPTCAPVAGGCEAIVDDIDGDGDKDVIVTEGQGVDLLVHRQTNSTFNVTSLATACPPHNLGTGDFDGDGVTDIAFFDQTSKAADENTTSLSLVYGNAFAAPNPPVSSGRFDEANGLSVVHFTPPGTGSQIAITRAVGPMEKRGSALGVVEVGSERTVVAPYYITSDIMGAQSLDSLTLIGQTPGQFGTNAQPALAVLTQSSADKRDLWLVESNANGGSLRAAPKSETKEIPCASGCIIAAVKHEGATDDLLLLGDKVAVIYGATDTGFAETSRFDSKYTFQQTVTNTNPAKYFPRPLVADVDHDGMTDVLALANTGELVGFFGKTDGSFTEILLIKAQTCWDSATGWGKAGCGNYVATQIDVDNDDFLDIVIAGSELPGAATSTSIAAYKLEKRSLKAVPGITIDADAFRSDSDFVGLRAADVDADGVQDIVFMPSSNFFTVLRGLPEHE